MALVPPNNTYGAMLWDMGDQGSDHTHQPGSPVNVLLDPEGVIYASPGVQAADLTGATYIKTTDVSVATGWCLVSCNDSRGPT